MTLTINPSSLARIDWGAKPESRAADVPQARLHHAGLHYSRPGAGAGYRVPPRVLDDTVRTPRDVARVGQMNLLA